jgi:hypothetical protein
MQAARHARCAGAGQTTAIHTKAQPAPGRRPFRVFPVHHHIMHADRSTGLSAAYSIDHRVHDQKLRLLQCRTYSDGMSSDMVLYVQA